MNDIISDVLMYMETGLISEQNIAYNNLEIDFKVSNAFIEELDLQEQIIETETTWED